MIQPTVGRVVWFHPGKDDHDMGKFEQTSDGRPMAAIVVHVWSDTCINVVAFDPNGFAHARTSVYLWQGEGNGQRPDSCFAEWMPFQKGQAAKTEQAEKAASHAKK